jgi:hypothetical protein
LHEQRSQPLAEWVLANERLDFADELGVAAEREVGLEPPLERPEAELFKARNLGLRERLVPEVGEGRPAPKVKSFAQSLRRQLGSRALRLLDQGLEAKQVELIWTDADHVTRLLRDDCIVWSERLSKL